MTEIFPHYFDSFTKGYNFAIRYDNQRLNDLDIAEQVGGIPTRPTGTDCKSVDLCLHRFESCFPHSKRK
jgi:hypothetical protein